MNRLVLAASAVCLASSTAFAADLPSRYRQPVAPYYDPVPTFAWGGLYGGLNAQLGIGSFTQGGNQHFGTPFGGIGGATIGYNYQSGTLLVGVEADAAFGQISGTGNYGNGTNSAGVINGLGTARARVGYIWDRALFYGTAGYAGTAVNGKVSDFGASPNLLVTESHYLNGGAIGAGIEYAVTTKISVKGEYLFTGFGSANYFTGTRDSTNAGAHINLIRFGLNYHF